MICSSVNLLFFTSVSSGKRTLPQSGGVSGEHVIANLVTSLIINIPKSRVDGVDADFTFRPTSRFTVKGAVTYIDTEVQQLGAGQTVYSGLTGLPFDPTGKQFNYALPWSVTYDAEYRYPLSGDLEGILGAGGQWYAKSYSDLGEEEALANRAYYTVDLRAGLQVQDRWQVSLWVRNLTDQTYSTSVFRATDMLSRFAGRPRTFGGTISFTY